MALYIVEWADLIPTGEPSVAAARVVWHSWFTQTNLDYLPECTPRRAWRVLDAAGNCLRFFHPRLDACREYLPGNRVRLRPLMAVVRAVRPVPAPPDDRMEYIRHRGGLCCEVALPDHESRWHGLQLQHEMRGAFSVVLAEAERQVAAQWPDGELSHERRPELVEGHAEGLPPAPWFDNIEWHREARKVRTVTAVQLRAAIDRAGGIAAMIKFTRMPDNVVATVLSEGEGTVSEAVFARLQLLG